MLLSFTGTFGVHLGTRTVIWYQHLSYYRSDEHCYFPMPMPMKNTSTRFLWPATSILAITDVTKCCYFPFAGTLGGHLGLFLGASILSITELTELLLLLLLRCFGCLRGTRRRTERSNTQSKTDGSVAVATVS